MVLFKDLNKSSADLLNKGFVHEKPWDLEYKYNSTNPQITNAACINSAGGFDASTTLKYTVNDLTTEIKLMAAGNSYVDLKYNVNKLKGLNLGCRFERKGISALKSGVIDLSSEYMNDMCHTKFTVSPLSTSFSTSTMFAKEPFKIGGEVTGTLDLRQLNYAFGASYSRRVNSQEWTTSLKTAPHGENAIGKILLNVHGKTNDQKGPSELGAEVSHVLADGKTSIVFGGLWHLNNEKNTTVKAKISQDAKLSLACTHRLCNNLSTTVGTQIDTSKASNPEAVRYGLKFDVSA